MVESDLDNVSQAEELANRYLVTCKQEGLVPHIDVDEIYAWIIYPEYKEFELRFANIYKKTDTEERWALTDGKKKWIVLDKSLRHINRCRYAFTFAHEMRHVIDFCKNPDLNLKQLSEEQLAALEHRADVFAAHLLMPTQFVTQKFLEKYGRGYVFDFFAPGDYYCDGKRKRWVQSQQELNRYFAQPLTPYFSHVSATSLSIRLQELGLLPRISSGGFRDPDFIERKNQERVNDLNQLFSKWTNASLTCSL